MSNNNFKPPADLPESREYVDQSNFEFSEYLTFDDWLDEEDPTSNASGSTHQNPVHQANEVSVFGGSESHVEGSSSNLPESREYVDQSNFEFSEYLTFDDWLDEEDPISNASGSTHQNPVHQANEVSVFGGSESHVEGSSSSKQNFL
ncbi:hypothetical protein CFP56_042477 [Quercus suber]|uniref:Uncharacterized protein n=1 Tax=Quercus suber TaxID=58331 RepID=A0AAW0LI73_QUESU